VSDADPTTAGLSLASTIGPIDAGIVPALLEAYRARAGGPIALRGAGTNRTLELPVAAASTS